MDEWFCEIAGREIGPLSSHQLKAMATRGQIVPTDRVRRGATGHWVAASHVRGLFAVAQSSPPAAAQSAAAAGPPSFFASSPPPTEGFSNVPQPNVAWTTETPIAPAAPPAGVSPLPFEPPVSGVTEDDSVLPDIFAEPAGHAATRHTAKNLALLARARRKRQQQMLVAGSLIFVIFGLAVSALLLTAGNFSDFIGTKDEIKQAGGLSGLSQKLERVAAQKSNEESDEKRPPRKSPERPSATKAKKPAGDNSADVAGLRMVVGDVPVRLVSVVRGGDAAGAADSQCVLVTVEVKNPSAHDKLEFAAWSLDTGLRGATLTDDQKKTYPPKSVNAAAVLDTPPPSSIEPGESARDVLCFALPDAKVQSLQLELPGAAFGKDATASFQIPAKMIADKPIVVKITPGASPDGGADSKTGSKAKKRSRAKPGTPEADFGLDEDEPAPR